MKYLFILLALSCSLHSFAETLRTLVRIEKAHGDLKVIRVEQGDHIPAIPKDQKIKKELEGMAAGTEAILEGQITYQQVSSDNARQLRPYFVIEKIHPVSLATLGAGTAVPDLQTQDLKIQESLVYQQPTFAVTTEVASAITLTTSMLMMEELTAGKGDPNGQREIRKALFLSAGTMATMLFLYEQLKGKSKP